MSTSVFFQRRRGRNKVVSGGRWDLYFRFILLSTELRGNPLGGARTALWMRQATYFPLRIVWCKSALAVALRRREVKTVEYHEADTAWKLQFLADWNAWFVYFLRCLVEDGSRTATLKNSFANDKLELRKRKVAVQTLWLYCSRYTSCSFWLPFMHELPIAIELTTWAANWCWGLIKNLLFIAQCRISSSTNVLIFLGAYTFNKSCSFLCIAG